MKRLFIAADISDEARGVASDLIRDLRTRFPIKGVSWVKPENLHITLKFLGDTNAEIEHQVMETIGKIADHTPPFTIKLDGPEMLGKRVLSIRVMSDATTVFDLEKRLDTECERLGFKREGRRFHPHLTLARIRDPKATGHLIKEFQGSQIEPIEFNVENVMLYESKLTPAGSMYLPLLKASLKKT